MTGPLGEGRRRRWPGALAAALALLLAPLAVTAAVYLAFVSDRDGGRPLPAAPPASAGPPVPAQPDAGGSLEPRSLAPVRLTGVDAFRLAFRKPPRAALLFDVKTGEVLYRRAPLRVLPIASLTKIMTALVVTQEARPGERVKIGSAPLRYQGTGLGVLRKGTHVRLETLLNGLLIVSAADAAIAMAVHISGSERRFVRLMNEKARLWGLRCTRFVSSHGLETGNRSCAVDLAVLTRLAMRKRRIRRIVRRAQASFRFPIRGGRLFLAGHNPLIRAGYRGTVGLKTGYTNAAGRCFVGVARRGGRMLGVVLLDSANPAKHAARLLNLGFRYG